MKRRLSIFAVAGILVLSAWSMTASAAEQTLVSFEFEEDFQPIEVYTLPGAQCFSNADANRYEYDFCTNQMLSCLQRTTNGFYCAVTQDDKVCYVLEGAVSEKPDTKKKAPVLTIECKDKTKGGILFVYTSFDSDLDYVLITDAESGNQIVLKGMACIDYQNTSFLTDASDELSVSKVYQDGSSIEQTFHFMSGKRMVGIYDDGSHEKSWIEIDGEFIFE